MSTNSTNIRIYSYGLWDGGIDDVCWLCALRTFNTVKICHVYQAWPLSTLMVFVDCPQCLCFTSSPFQHYTLPLMINPPHPHPHPVGAVIVGVFTAYLSLIIIWSWSCQPLSIAPLSTPQAWLMAMVGGAVSPGCHAGTVPVPLIIITLCHLISNNKMKRLYTFLPAEVRALHCSFWSSLGCSWAPPCVIAVGFLPHFLTHVAVMLQSPIHCGPDMVVILTI